MEKKFPILLATCLMAGTLLAGCGSNGAEENSNQSEDNSASTGMEDNSVTEDSAGGEGAGDTSTDNGTKENKAVNLDEGIDTVLTNLEELKSTLENASDDYGKINELGMSIDSSWDEIETQIEENYPDDYKTIEESLYPLIDESKKDEPDSAKMNELLDETMKKLNEFKEKMAT
ncbi:hypothetical protein [Pseudalkalibacillus hwajinpoensis]|uniref:Uncharacterized protein n=1 Tax=Guptibacillus hwajinpoensis TaxID=208199 RepID=A0A4U1MNW2_9BACL|nr:hypothetical protein [Pseudalkalibacillus hwajinpoensis]TKD72342.1 hypothetical protein FBF83_06050 [Pseudalkalibacillus hwajinpoensis]